MLLTTYNRPNCQLITIHLAQGQGVRVCVVSDLCPVCFSLLATLCHPFTTLVVRYSLEVSRPRRVRSDEGVPS